MILFLIYQKKIFLLMSWNKHLKITIPALLWFALWGLYGRAFIWTEALGPPRGWIFRWFSRLQQATSCLNTPREQTCLNRTGLGSIMGLLLENSRFCPLGRKVPSAAKHWENNSVSIPTWVRTLQSWLKCVANMAWPWFMGPVSLI